MNYKDSVLGEENDDPLSKYSEQSRIEKSKEKVI